jgi:hypothetical protein
VPGCCMGLAVNHVAIKHSPKKALGWDFAYRILGAAPFLGSRVAAAGVIGYPRGGTSAANARRPQERLVMRRNSSRPWF